MKFKYAAYTNVTIDNGNIRIGAGDEEPSAQIAYSNNLNKLRNYFKKEQQLIESDSSPDNALIEIKWTTEYNNHSIDDNVGIVVGILLVDIIDSKCHDQYTPIVIVKNPEQITVIE